MNKKELELIEQILLLIATIGNQHKYNNKLASRIVDAHFLLDEIRQGGSHAL